MMMTMTTMMTAMMKSRDSKLAKGMHGGTVKGLSPSIDALGPCFLRRNDLLYDQNFVKLLRCNIVRTYN